MTYLRSCLYASPSQLISSSSSLVVVSVTRYADFMVSTSLTYTPLNVWIFNGGVKRTCRTKLYSYCTLFELKKRVYIVSKLVFRIDLPVATLKEMVRQVRFIDAAGGPLSKSVGHRRSCRCSSHLEEVFKLVISNTRLFLQKVVPIKTSNPNFFQKSMLIWWFST